MNGSTAKEIKKYLKINLGFDKGPEFKKTYRRHKKAYTRLSRPDKKEFLSEIRVTIQEGG
jgi:preprotein translocase subunit Sss1